MYCLKKIYTHNVRTIAVKNKDYFWVKMKDIQDNLKVKNVPQLCGIYEKMV